MKATVALALAAIFACGVASAEEPFVGVFADPAGEDCYPRDIVPGVFQIHVVMKYMACTSAVEFMLESSEGFDGVFLGEEMADPGWIRFGNSATGTQLAFGDRLSPPVHVLTLSYYCQGLSDECSYFEIVGNPVSGLIQYVDCTSPGDGGPFLLPAKGGRVYVNAHDGCPCEAPGAILATETATWGTIKSLYAD